MTIGDKMTIIGYFIGFFTGATASAVVANFDLSIGIEILLSTGCAFVGILGIKALEKLKETIE